MFVAASASAEGFNIDFSAPNYPSVPSSTFGAAAGQPGFWNKLDSIFSGNLSGLDGSATPAFILGSATGTSAWPFNGGSADALTLMTSAIMVNATSALHFNDVAEGFYTVYLYSSGGSLPTSVRIQAGTSVFNQTINSQVPWEGAFVPGTNYVSQNLFVGADGSFTITFPSSVSTPLSGLQLVPIPTPGIATVGLGAALLAGTRRRR